MIICYRFQLLYRDSKDFAADGLNSVKYQVLKTEFKKLYTRIYVSVNESEIKQVGYVRLTFTHVCQRESYNYLLSTWF